ncbi:hypothetical protein B0H15DRAFT_857700 [Mycena belliarum]|uniref:Uncharacterized protein n=1 Tax=Mycena belliarum TaxID=1033014 RepID=A0AAD6U000_9AGAR|nr:hypothetical protein B0H15DRAFT_857700 [Mycena belliae]
MNAPTPGLVTPGPVSLQVQESRTKRLGRQQARFRDRGGIFVPRTHNNLIDILLGRKNASPLKRRSRSRSRSVSVSPTKKHASKTKGGTVSRRKSSKAPADDEKPVAGPSRLPEPSTKGKAKKPKPAGAPKRKGRAPKSKATTTQSIPTSTQELTAPVKQKAKTGARAKPTGRRTKAAEIADEEPVAPRAPRARAAKARTAYAELSDDDEGGVADTELNQKGKRTCTEEVDASPDKAAKPKQLRSEEERPPTAPGKRKLEMIMEENEDDVEPVRASAKRRKADKAAEEEERAPKLKARKRVVAVIPEVDSMPEDETLAQCRLKGKAKSKTPRPKPPLDPYPPAPAAAEEEAKPKRKRVVPKGASEEEAVEPKSKRKRTLKASAEEDAPPTKRSKPASAPVPEEADAVQPVPAARRRKAAEEPVKKRTKKPPPETADAVQIAATNKKPAPKRAAPERESQAHKENTTGATESAAKVPARRGPPKSVLDRVRRHTNAHLLADDSEDELDCLS